MVSDKLSGAAPKRPRLLLVEDDAGVRRSLQLLLQAKGFDVRAYATGAALLADPSSINARCIVADYSMDNIDGLEVLSRLRTRGWVGPAVLITAYSSPTLQERACAEGFNVVLEKPFRDHTLVETINRLSEQEPEDERP
ncbi:response regulator [Novosphingobium sp. RD2P27]|uniref:Response regulator n=1 Tax=Novosphingobium kalidii TaxID=3230299 RepID=A0ABV2CY73_9SPHN